MNHLDYKNEIIELKRQVAVNQSNEEFGSKQLQSAIISASLYNLMPEINVEQHAGIIENIAFFQNWAARDQQYTDLLRDVTFEGIMPDFQKIQQEPTIFCSFHIGSYRLLAPYLMVNKIKFTLLIDANVAEMQSSDFQVIFEKVQKEQGIDEGSYKIIDTFKGNILFTMLEQLKRGRSLLIFIDGNTGVDGRSADRENLADINFLGNILHSRKGIAYLSHRAKVSITPMLTYRNPLDIWQNVIQFFPPIAPASTAGRDEFVNTALSQIYEILENTLSKVFEQWESWRYIEKSLAVTDAEVRRITVDIDSLDVETLLKFNENRYLLAPFDAAQYVLFDRSYYRSNFITPNFMAFFQCIISTGISIKESLKHACMTKSALKLLLEKEILELSTK